MVHGLLSVIFRSHSGDQDSSGDAAKMPVSVKRMTYIRYFFIIIILIVVWYLIRGAYVMSYTHGEMQGFSVGLKDQQMNSSNGGEEVKDSFLVKQRPAPRANCKKLFNNDMAEIKRVLEAETQKELATISEAHYILWTKNCADFKQLRGYITYPLSEEEVSFRLAYSIEVTDNLEQFDRLLQAIYMPQNYYCLYMDENQPPEFHQAIVGIAKCFRNIHLCRKKIDKSDEDFSIFDADLRCMTYLYKKKKWKYYINLSGNEFPLKTNLDLVRIFKIFNGSVQIEASAESRRLQKMETLSKSPIPQGITLAQGSRFIAVPREFIGFVLYNHTAAAFHEWMKDNGLPDKLFFSSLSHSAQIGTPGAYKGYPEADRFNYPYLVQYQDKEKPECAWLTKITRCLTSVNDLHALKNRPELFVGMLMANYSPSTFDCLEELHFQRTREGQIGKHKVDLDFYRNFDFVKNHV